MICYEKCHIFDTEHKINESLLGIFSNYPRIYLQHLKKLAGI
jgi:hypothetical protein